MKLAHHVEPISPLECDYCGIEFDDDDELAVHKPHHLNRPKYQCLECEYCGPAPKDLKQHMRTHVSRHENVLILCSNKNKIIPKLQIRWNKCGICDKGFVNSSLLETHTKRHDLNIECYVCKFRTISSQKLRAHMRVEHVSCKLL